MTKEIDAKGCCDGLKNTLVVNLFGAPGAGKSTGAAYIFSNLKIAGVDAELVTEFAKDTLWDGAKEPFKNQVYMLGEQYYRMSRLVGKVDVIVTDSPLPLSIYYNQNKSLSPHFDKLVIDVFNTFNNMNYFVNRLKCYNQNGRFETEAESDEVAKSIKRILKKYSIQHTSVFGDQPFYYDMTREILNNLSSISRGEGV